LEKDMDYEIRDIGLATKGRERAEWAGSEMPVLTGLKRAFQKEKPLRGQRISACLHITSETANLMEVLVSGGATVALCASNPLSTQDDIAAHLVKHLGIQVFGYRGATRKDYYRHIRKALSVSPSITMDDGCDLVTTLASLGQKAYSRVIGGTEETTTGVIRLKAMERNGVLPYPIIAVNDARTKYLFDNRYGTGQSTIDGILRATNTLIAGKTFVIAGYGWCGRGLAMRARGMGANVIVTEVNQLRALEASMDGFRVMRMMDAAPIGDIFVTVTGCKNVISKKHFLRMKDGAIIANSGHFDVEIDKDALFALAKKKRTLRTFVTEFELKNGKRIRLLAEGRLVNLSAAEGHPPAVMDMSFANQALSVEYLARYGKKLEVKVHPVPETIDIKVAELKLSSLGLKIDRLSKEQKEYLSSFAIGT